MPATLLAVKLVVILLPGLIGAGAYSYVRNAPLSTTALVVMAIFLSMVANAATAPLGLWSPLIEEITEANLHVFVTSGYFFAASVVAIAAGLGLARLVESRWLQRQLNRAGLSRHYSVDSVWDQAFRDNEGRWATFHFRDGSQIVGYAKFYSIREDERQVCIGRATFHYRESAGKVSRAVERDAAGDVVVVKGDDIALIEFHD